MNFVFRDFDQYSSLKCILSTLLNIVILIRNVNCKRINSRPKNIQRNPQSQSQQQKPNPRPVAVSKQKYKEKQKQALVMVRTNHMMLSIMRKHVQIHLSFIERAKCFNRTNIILSRTKVNLSRWAPMLYYLFANGLDSRLIQFVKSIQNRFELILWNNEHDSIIFSIY